MLPPASPLGGRCSRAACCVPRVEPAHGRYSRRKAALRLAWWARESRGAAGRAAIRSGLVPGRPAPSHSPAEPQRSRGGGAASPVPGAGWRSARPPGTGLGAPPAGNPLGQPWDEGAEPPCQDPAFTSGDLARLARRPDPLCHSRVGWPWLTSPSFVWKLI